MFLKIALINLCLSFLFLRLWKRMTKMRDMLNLVGRWTRFRRWPNEFSRTVKPSWCKKSPGWWEWLPGRRWNCSGPYTRPLDSFDDCLILIWYKQTIHWLLKHHPDNRFWLRNFPQFICYIDRLIDLYRDIGRMSAIVPVYLVREWVQFIDQCNMYIDLLGFIVRSNSDDVMRDISFYCCY